MRAAAAVLVAVVLAGIATVSSQASLAECMNSAYNSSCATNYGGSGSTGKASSLVATSTSAVCRWRQANRWAKNLAGTILWRYHEQVNWCYVPGVRVTSISTDRWASCCFPFWDYQGTVETSASGGVGDFSASRFAQGKMQLCIPKLLCVQTITPWVRITVNANGGSGYTTGN